MFRHLLSPVHNVAVYRKDTIEDSYEDFIKCNYSLQDVKLVERATRGQANNQQWHQFRKGAITASRAKDICTMTSSGHHAAGINKMLNDLLDPPDVQSASTDWGCSQEKISLDWYHSKQSTNHSGFSLRQTGLYMSTENSLVGASPDALCYCKCCRHPYRKWLVEVKSPYNNRFMEPSDAAWETGAFTSHHDGTLKLKSDHKWHYQVQLQMGVVGVQLCDLVISTTRGNWIVPVYFNEAFYEEMMLKFNRFIDQYLFPKLYDRNMVVPAYQSEEDQCRLRVVRLGVDMENITRALRDLRLRMA